MYGPLLYAIYKLCKELLISELYIYIWSENSSPKSEAKDGTIGRLFQSLSNVFVCAVGKECAIISYFDFDLKNAIL